MKTLYFSPIALVGMLMVWTPSAQALSAVDFNGNYDIHYTSGEVNFEVKLLSPMGTAYSFPLAFTVTLDANEQVPYSALDPILQNAPAVIEEYYPDMPAALEDALLQAFTTGLYRAVDQINLQAEVLPDIMNLTALSAKFTTVTGVFTDSSSGSQVSLVGSLTPGTDGIGLLVLNPLMQGKIDSTRAYMGSGYFYAEDVAVDEIVKGFHVMVTGSGYINMNLARQ